MYRVIKTYGHERCYSCSFRQWNAKSNCKYLHCYSLGFKITLESPTLDKNNWVYNFGDFSFLEKWLDKNFDHTLLVASDDPEKKSILKLNNMAAKVNELEKISCEFFAEMTYKFVPEHLMSENINVVSVEVSEHGSNAASYYEE